MLEEIVNFSFFVVVIAVTLTKEIPSVSESRILELLNLFMPVW